MFAYEIYVINHECELVGEFCTCTEFWWCLNNVAKGLWREELLYVNDMINFCVRKQLEKVISWQIGIKTDFAVSVGKSAKYIYKWIPYEWFRKCVGSPPYKTRMQQLM